ncbi:hypothetical protein [Vibrio caribbeanicus]|uniref:Uncharacterized protein n=1 Tax=Vibrio caribbeanicus ATCC BAA-2122 TaxID=796620 RepID=E3BI07_9VIBR|nr:hypothetical protein [Vibrio caribbeanicus]EFP97446.1 hypothetical protein VIBC2010_18684 [Vibrio caribbeanicus ATCC BAA-2122]
MKPDALKSVGEALASRFKTPLVSSFIFAWLMVNHTVVLEFLLTTVDTKLEMIKVLQFDWETDVLFPLLSALLFIIFVPVLQLSLDVLVFVVLGDLRKKLDEKVANNALRSTVEHQAKLVDAELENWSNEKKSLTAERDKLQLDLHNIEDKFRDSEKTVKILKSEIREFESVITDTIEILDRPNQNIGTEYEFTGDISELNSRALDKLKWSLPEHMPF